MHAKKYHSEGAFTDAHGLLSKYLGQLGTCVTAMVFTIFATWLSPVLPAAPTLWIFVPPGGPKKIIFICFWHLIS